MPHNSGVSRMNEFSQSIGEPLTWQPRPPFQATTLIGAVARVEPLAEEHFPALFEVTNQPERWTYMPVGPFAGLSEFEQAMRAAIADPDRVPLTIVVDGAVVGTASYLRIDPAIGTVEVGWIMYSPNLARSRAATEVMYLMAAHVFDDLGYRRYEWKCDALNEPSRKAAERLGFRYEGTWHKATMYKGRNRDTAWFAMTDDDWARLAPRYRAWLAGGNFDETGRQRRTLAACLRPDTDQG